MPQRICMLCIDKINDFYEYREMCIATNIQTRKFLGVPEQPKRMVAKTVIQSSNDKDDVESIFGIVGDDTKKKTEPIPKTNKKTKKTPNATITSAASAASAPASNPNRFRGMSKREVEIALELERIKKEEGEETKQNVVEDSKFDSDLLEVSKYVRGPYRKKGKKGAANAASEQILLAPKPPNQRERKREVQQKKNDR